jgi:2-deoxy-D-gluconate 3-dehydrogenase
MGPNSTNEAGRQYYFADKLIIVTGATSGIGKSVATWFLEHGAKVGVVGRNEAVLSEF